MAMNDYVILRRNAWKTPEDLERAAGRSSRVGSEEMPEKVRWIRTYVYREADGTLGSACIYQAVDREAVVEHAQRSGLACDEVMPLAQTVVISADPAPNG